MYAAPCIDALAEKVDRKESVWCGWHNFLGQHSCVARVSPFAAVHVAVEHEYSSGTASHSPGRTSSPANWLIQLDLRPRHNRRHQCVALSYSTLPWVQGTCVR